MEFVRPGIQIDFMRYRKPVISASLLLVALAVTSLFVPGPKYGLDFTGGTEVQLRFNGDVTAGELRTTIEGLGYVRPDVVAVEDGNNEYLIRIQEVSSLSAGEGDALRKLLEKGVGGAQLTELEVSPGGDKLTISLSETVDEAALQTALAESKIVRVRAVNSFGKPADHRYEAHLFGVADELVKGLQQGLGERGPQAPEGVEWVGPKAGQQLRDAAIKSLLYALAFIMVYVAFRFDLRFSPGAVLAMLHDVLITLGVYVLLQKEISLATVAALLTILGYSINDTIVVYDRIRENMARMRDKSLRELINISTSQMLSRTIVTSLTTMVSVSAFFFWGTPVIQDIAFAFMIGIFVGTYSSIYVAAPTTEWMDRRLFASARSKAVPSRAPA